MNNLKKLSLKKEVEKEAERIEQEVKNREDLQDITVSDEMEASLFNKIQEYEYDKRIKLVYRKKKRRHIILALAAVLILVCGSVMTGVGSKSYWKVIWDRIVGEENVAVINVENMESKQTEDLDEMGVYREITQAFGVSTVRMNYMPQGMVLERYTLDAEQRKATLFYRYKNEIIRYTMYMNDADSSVGQKELDKMIDEFEIVNGNVTIEVEEYQVSSTEEKRYIAEFEYQDVQYQLKGIIDKSELEKIVENLIFL